MTKYTEQAKTLLTDLALFCFEKAKTVDEPKVFAQWVYLGDSLLWGGDEEGDIYDFSKYMD